MKKVISSIAVLVFLFAASSLSAQGIDKKAGPKGGPQSMQGGIDKRTVDKRDAVKNNKPPIDLSEAEIGAIEKAVKAKVPAIEQARADLEVVRAQIQRELVNKDVNLSKVRELVKASLAQEEILRMSEIEIQVQIRQIVGEDKWVQISKFMRMNADRPKDQGPGQEDRLLGILNKLR